MDEKNRGKIENYIQNPEQVYEIERDYITKIRTNPEQNEKPDYAPIGLSLSGGGIRSATICLGALQALYKHKYLNIFDYLSSVSGGGFIGGFLTTLIHNSSKKDKASILNELDHSNGEIESEVFRDLRNYSEYLAPKGIVDKLRIPAIIFSGFFINFICILPWLLILTVLMTIISIDLVNDLSSVKVNMEFQEENFPTLSSLLRSYYLTSLYLILLLVLIFCIPFFNLFVTKVINPLSTHMNSTTFNELRNHTKLNIQVEGILLIVLIMLIILESQPTILFFIDQYFWETKIPPIIAGSLDTNIDLRSLDTRLEGFVIGYSLVFSFILSVIVFRVARPEKAHQKFISQKLKEKFKEFLLFIIGPLTLWLLFAFLSTLSLNHTLSDDSLLKKIPAQYLSNFLEYLNGLIPSRYYWPSDWNPYIETSVDSSKRNDTFIILSIYLIISLVLYLYSRLFIDFNHTSLHRFYREKICSAFFVPSKEKKIEANTRLNQDKIKLSKISDSRTLPFLIINTTINLHNSSSLPHKRSADSFFFSPLYSGSTETGYCRTVDLERKDHNLDLGATTAISGAAAAPIMGRMTVKPLIFLFALLNVRLGYWLPNPMNFKDKRYKNKRNSKVGLKYLVAEAFGKANKKDKYVFLTDGGHSDNSGIYQLLRRKCKLIVAVDGEMDKHHSFGGLSNVIRLARIDLGIDIEINVDNLVPDNLGYSKKHYSVALIRYSKNEQALLIYLKSSLTGDENLYVSSYKNKMADFPHESTSDQFFSEEQFESYRSLGYHIVNNFLGNDDNQDAIASYLNNKTTAIEAYDVLMKNIASPG